MTSCWAVPAAVVALLPACGTDDTAAGTPLADGHLSAERVETGSAGDRAPGFGDTAAVRVEDGFLVVAGHGPGGHVEAGEEEPLPLAGVRLTVTGGAGA